MIGICDHSHKQSLAHLLMGLFLMMPVVTMTAGCNLLSLKGGDQSDVDVDDNVKPNPDPGPVPDQKYPESEYWEALAQLVEIGRFSNTDQIYLTAKSERSLDHVSDLSRVAAFEAKRQDVTADNRKGLADLIRGK